MIANAAARVTLPAAPLLEHNPARHGLSTAQTGLLNNLAASGVCTEPPLLAAGIARRFGM